MKYIPVYACLAMSVFYTSCEQNQTPVAEYNTGAKTKDTTSSRKYEDSLARASVLNAEISKEKEAGTIYSSSSPHHGVVHEFTYWMAMRDFCDKKILQMRTTGDAGKKLSERMEKELLNAKAALDSSKFNGLQIEMGLYEKFLEQISDQFKG